MGEQDQERSTSIIRSKQVVIAVVAAVGMMLGAMSVGAAVMVYKNTPVVLGSQPAPGNPFVTQTQSSRHTTEAAASQEVGQIAGAQFETAGPSLSATVGPAPTAAALPAPASPGKPAVAVPRPIPAIPSAPALPPQRPLEVPLKPIVQPALDSLRTQVVPLTPTPVQQTVNALTGNLPGQLNLGPLQVALPRIGL